MTTIFAKLSAVAIGVALFAPAQATTSTSVYIASHNGQQTLAAKNFNALDNRGFNLQTWDVSTSAGKTFLALCVEPGANMGMENQSYAADSTFKFADLTPGVERQTSIARLYGLYYDKITGADEASKDLSLSFQLALWELYNDDATFETAATGKLAVNNTITGGRGNGAGGYAGAAPIVTDAYKMLAEAKDKSLAYTQQYTFTRYTSGTSQDFVIAQAVSAVPEPSTYAMLGLGLAVVGFAARRRAKR